MITARVVSAQGGSRLRWSSPQRRRRTRRASGPTIARSTRCRAMAPTPPTARLRTPRRSLDSTCRSRSPCRRSSQTSPANQATASPVVSQRDAPLFFFIGRLSRRSRSTSAYPDRDHCLTPVEVKQRAIGVHHRKVEPQRLHVRSGIRPDQDSEGVLPSRIRLVKDLGGMAEYEGPLLRAGNNPDAVGALCHRLALQQYVSAEADGACGVRAGIPFPLIRHDAAEQPAPARYRPPVLDRDQDSSHPLLQAGMLALGYGSPARRAAAEPYQGDCQCREAPAIPPVRPHVSSLKSGPWPRPAAARCCPPGESPSARRAASPRPGPAGTRSRRPRSRC